MTFIYWTGWFLTFCCLPPYVARYGGDTLSRAVTGAVLALFWPLLLGGWMLRVILRRRAVA